MKKEDESLYEVGFGERVLRYCFVNQQKIIRYSLCILVIGVFAIFYAARGADIASISKAKVAFEQWKQTPGDAALTQDMEKALQKTAGFRRTLEAEIAQVLLSDGQIEQADPFATACIQRLQEDCPLHAEFAKATLYIEQKEYQKALEASVSLKEQFATADASSNLYGWNLVRVAFLQKQLQNPSGELAAWEDVKNFFFGEENKVPEIGIGRPGFSLADFIANREKELS